MSMLTSPRPSSSEARDRQWYIVCRWQEYAGEARANLLRIVGVAVFYAIELVRYHGLPAIGATADSFLRPEAHQIITSLAAAWVLLALGVIVCLRRRVFPGVLKYLSTAGDLVLLTAILTIARGPKSPLVAAYLLIIVLAGLRFSVGLVWFAMLGAAVGYLVLLGEAKWFETSLAVGRDAQLFFLVTIGLSGVFVGQIVRRARGMAEEFAARLAQTSESEA